MELNNLGHALIFPFNILFCILKACFGLLLPSRRKDLRGEVVLITGGGRGIGRHLGKEFAKHGAKKVILWGRTERCLKETCEEISLTTGVECHYFLCDVANREEVYKQAKVVREKVLVPMMKITGLIFLSGRTCTIVSGAEQCADGHVSLFLSPSLQTTKAFLPRILELCHGHVVCINSILSLSSIPGAIDYCTSKASSLAFMESLTLGLLDCPGVGCTTVLPFHTNTDMFQGMKVRFPQLFPPLNPELVAQRTVDAVRTNTPFVYLPWTMHALVILKSLLPQAALEEIHRFSGCYTCMDTFKGRT
ncbi:unnamed protein product [Oncorhynchus mykiss]|uniref:Short-chain dehydrogenase/reductase 3 n=1 Tax=Oncorhynchus mykiss TaxID=8022 RepID=A0A060WTF6_ONCMY|nr:unnamed protein product [Oncorhynchus mykiss]